LGASFRCNGFERQTAQKPKREAHKPSNYQIFQTFTNHQTFQTLKLSTQSFLFMKKLLLLLLIIGQTGLAQTPKTIKTRVDKVTVFNRGAQIFATEKVSLPVGATDLIFETGSERK